MNDQGLRRRSRLPSAAAVVIVLALGAWGADAARAQPKVADGFEIRLVAAVPAVQYPCQVATAPDGSLFVAENPMDQTGPADQPIDRILLFREGKDPVVFAEKLAAVFGMAWRDGALYVMHMPYLSVLRDSDGDGKADQREDLFQDLGLKPGAPNQLNDHIVSGIQFGMDGWLYIASGDKGVPKVMGRDGRTAQLVGGGVLRCRPDGTGIEVFSRGTRNHLEPNLDELDRVFTYDNTDDGDGWWTRVSYHIDGGYYGYPYDYHDYQYRMIPRIAEYGGGSPCGGVVYREDAWPESLRGRVLWAEWGKRKVSAFAFERDGAGFKVKDEIVLAEADRGDDFRPLDLALSHDGVTLYVADWGMGGWGNKTEKVGRVYAITPKTPVKAAPRGSDADPIDAQARALAHPAHAERMRAQAALIRKGRGVLTDAVSALKNPQTPALAARHWVWVLDGIAGGTPEATLPFVETLKSPNPELRAQAARALGQRAVPLAAAVEGIAGLLGDPDPDVRLQAIVALGRIGDAGPVARLVPFLGDADPYLAFAARAAARRIGDWKTVASGLESPDLRVRRGTMETLELSYDPDAVRALERFVFSDRRGPAERGRALELLAQGHRKALPWDGRWWGTRPTQGKAFPKTVDWEGTSVIASALRKGLADPNEPIRSAAVAAIRATGNPDALDALRQRFAAEANDDLKARIALTLGDLRDEKATGPLVEALGDPKVAAAVRDAALKSVVKLGAREAITALIQLIERPAAAPEIQSEAIAALGQLKAERAAPALLAKLTDPAPRVRAASAEALGKIGPPKAKESVGRLAQLANDPDLSVRKAAVQTLGEWGDKAALPTLRQAAESEATRFEAGLALAKIPDVSVLSAYLRGLTDKSADLRTASADAIHAVRDQAAPILEELAKRKELSPTVAAELRKVYNRMEPIENWRTIGPFKADAPIPFAALDSIDLDAKHEGRDPKRKIGWRTAQPVDARGQINLGRAYGDSEQEAYGYAETVSPAPRKTEMAVGSDDTLTVWLNGKLVYEFKQNRGFAHEQARVPIELQAGVNRVLVRCGNTSGGWQYSVQIAAQSDYGFLQAPAAQAFDLDAYRAYALSNPGDPQRGRILFRDPKGLACLKCHAVDGEGGKVGPELSDVAIKYPKAELITSVLQPSARISSGYESAVVGTVDGRVVNGIVKSDAPDAIELEDADAKRIRVPKDEVDFRKTSEVSLMPNGLAEGLTPKDFADLMSYLETLKKGK